MVAPELAVPGKTTAVLVTLHGPAGKQPLNVSLKLVPDGKAHNNEQSQILLETIQEIKGNVFYKLFFALIYSQNNIRIHRNKYNSTKYVYSNNKWY